MSRRVIDDFFRPSSPYVHDGAADPTRLGVHLAGNGVDIAVVAPNASAVEICFFTSAEPTAPETRYRLLGPVDGIWHGHVSGVLAGTYYGLRTWGAWNPERGHVFNPYKLALDPYARAISGNVQLCSQTYAHKTDDQLYPLHPFELDPTNSAPYTVRGVVTGKEFDVAPGPATPWENTVIYEAHVKGLTKQLPGVPEELRGTYAGLAHPATIAYLKDLGITAVELLPVHAKLSEAFLNERGLSNYWGYSTLSYFAPEPSYATKNARMLGPMAVLDEFRGMVSILHQNGIELLLDVVYNHTCEGGGDGQALSWRALDNAMYYRLDSQGGSIDYSGCGNTLDTAHPRVIQMIMDSLRYWAGDVGVDGFRFDLGVTCGRGEEHFTRFHPFFQACLDDPVLRNKKMIAEPWDVGPDGWRTSDFPLPFSTWNDRYRDSVRGFWIADGRAQSRGESRGAPPFELASRLSGSQDMYGVGDVPAVRPPRCSINFVTAHDGFTLGDLVSFDHKHNEENLENNRDGSPNNLSWNHGSEGRAFQLGIEKELALDGDSPLAELLNARVRSALNLFTTIFISAGTPMILAGDEFARTQGGNNNAYCQDNETTWLNWELVDWQKDFYVAVRKLITLRREHPVFRPKNYLTGQRHPGDSIPDLSWYNQVGLLMGDRAWHDPASRVFQMLRSGRPYGDQDLLVVFNGTLDPKHVRLAPGRGTAYHEIWDSAVCEPEEEAPPFNLAGDDVFLEPLSIKLFLADSSGD